MELNDSFVSNGSNSPHRSNSLEDFTLLGLDDFFENHIKQDKTSFMSSKQVFIAYRSFLNIKYTNVVATMDYNAFKYCFQRHTVEAGYTSQVVDRNILYGISFCHLDTLEEMHSQNKEVTEHGDTVMIKANELNTILCCRICAGYLVEPYTVQECLHTFCKSCILMHFRASIFCPFCGIMVNEINPFEYVKKDIVMQEIMNKIFPGIPISEQSRANKFNTKHKNELEVTPRFCKPASSNQVDFILLWVGPENCTLTAEPIKNKFTRVSREATIGHVSQLVLQMLGKLDSSTDAVPTLQCIISSGGVTIPSFFTLGNFLEYKLNFEMEKKLPVLRYDLRPLQPNLSKDSD